MTVTPCTTSVLVQEPVRGESFVFPLKDWKVQAGSSGSVVFPLNNVHLQAKNDSIGGLSECCESWLDVSVMQRAEAADLSHEWNSQGFETLHTSFSHPALHACLSTKNDTFVGSGPPVDNDMDSTTTTSYIETSTGRALLIKWANGATATVNALSGLMTSWIDATRLELIKSPLEVCVFRAGTDNDRGGQSLSHYNSWIEMGLDRLETVVEGDSAVVSVTEISGATVVTVKFALRPVDRALLATFTRCVIKYSFNIDGTVCIESTVTPDARIPTLPRCGLRFSTTTPFDQATWLGLGPHEAYPDRQESAYLGVHSQTLEDMHTKYVVAQDCGRRAAPR
jgi:hypothetical protein